MRFGFSEFEEAELCYKDCNDQKILAQGKAVKWIDAKHHFLEKFTEKF